VIQPVSCSECGSAVPRDAPDGICPTCLWQLGWDEPNLAALVSAPSTDAIGSTVRTVAGLEETASVGVLAPPRRAARQPTDAAAPPILRRLGNYDLIEELGRGGMGVVFKAVQRRADRLVAVKLILGGAASGAEDRERFESEVQALARLKHPNIVPVFEVGDVEDCPYYSMEYMPGGTLSQLAKDGPLPPEKAAAIVETLAGAVEAAHQVGVLHRDIKPGNVLLDAEGTPKLTDFGLAKRLDRDDGLTHTGSVLGTPGYMPPEQARGERYLTPAADVYSLGATLFALLAGRPPFAGKDFHDTLQKVLQDDAPRLRGKRPDVSRDLEAVCLKCLEKDSHRRYATAQALADDLARWREGASTIARPQSLARRALRQALRRWRPAALAGTLIGGTLLAVALAALLVVYYRDPVRTQHADLLRGETLTLIKAAGPPKWQRWAAGTGSVSDAAASGPFQVFSAGSGLLELVPTVPRNHFRITAEFKHEEAVDATSCVGIYVARSEAENIEDSVAARAVLVFFRDRPGTQKSVFSIGDILDVQDSLLLSTPAHPFLVQGSPQASLAVKEPKPSVQRPWRRVIAEVGPAGIRVQFFSDLNGPPRDAATKPIQLNRFWQQNPAYREWLKTNHPEVTSARLEYAPHGGCGIFVRNAKAMFRNVVVEPLP